MGDISVKANIEEFVALHQALGDATRLRLLMLLSTGEVCVCHLHEALDLPQPRVSRHLGYLRRTGLVSARKEGLWVHYRLTVPPDPAVEAVRRAALEALASLDLVHRDRERLRRVTHTATLPAPVEAPCCLGAADQG